MTIDVIRIYAEVLEQGIDFKEYLIRSGAACPILNIYTKKSHGKITEEDSVVNRLRKSKDADILITAIGNHQEYPILMVEYSSAVPADDHKMQRSDVYYWGAVYKIPVLKIYPSNKGLQQQFGGVSKIHDRDEIRLAHKIGAVFYPITWNTGKCHDILDTKENSLSCLKENTEIQNILTEILHCFQICANFHDFYKKMIKMHSIRYADILSFFSNDKIDPKKLIANSSRFKWDTDKLIVKINRFGHAMDPERGILYFANMLVGAKNTITEIQINRSSNFYARAGYQSLFDSAPKEKEMCDYVKNLICTQNNIFTEENALHILTSVLSLPSNLIQKSAVGQYRIKEESLYHFLIHHPSMVAKSIFFLSTKLILTDVNRDIICAISWEETPLHQYQEALYDTNYTPLAVLPLTTANAKEDIVTFASAAVYKKLHFHLLAVSYPGAQGDRCILTGKGRKVLRTYIDIIAYQEKQNDTIIFMEECKDNPAKSANDIKKLNAILGSEEKIRGLKKLYAKVTDKDHNISDIYIGIGAKAPLPAQLLGIDYAFAFHIDNSIKDKTLIHYNIVIINTKLGHIFSSLTDNEGKLSGTLMLDKIYVVK